MKKIKWFFFFLKFYRKPRTVVRGVLIVSPRPGPINRANFARSPIVGLKVRGKKQYGCTGRDNKNSTRKKPKRLKTFSVYRVRRPDDTLSLTPAVREIAGRERAVRVKHPGQLFADPRGLGLVQNAILPMLRVSNTILSSSPLCVVGQRQDGRLSNKYNYCYYARGVVLMIIYRTVVCAPEQYIIILRRISAS